MLGRIYEVHALQHKAVSLLDTYLGSHAGERVLNGLIRRGDGQGVARQSGRSAHVPWGVVLQKSLVIFLFPIIA